MLIDKMPPEAHPEDPVWTTTIMTYELGSLIRALVYARHKRNQGEEDSARAHLASARIEFSDLITQCHVLAEQMRWHWVDAKNDGFERFGERMKEIEEYEL